MYKYTMLAFMILSFFWFNVAEAEQGQPYVPRSDERPAEETVYQIVDGPNQHKFYLELKENCDMTLGHLTEAAEQGNLVVRKCGDCSLETAALFYGRSVYWRLVRPGEVVVYVHGCPVFLNNCGNPVRDPHRSQKTFVKVMPPPSPMPVVQEQVTPSPPVAQKPQPPPEWCRRGPVFYKRDGIRIPGVLVGYGHYGMYPWYFDSGEVMWTTSVHPVTCVYNLSPTDSSETQTEEESTQ